MSGTDTLKGVALGAGYFATFHSEAWSRIQRDGVIGDFTHLAFTMRLGDGWGSDAYLARQPFFRDYPRLLMYETGVHFVDTVRYLLGEVVSVFAQLRQVVSLGQRRA